MKSPDRGLNPGWPSSSAAAPSTTSGNSSPAHTAAAADWSNSSWAEMESKIIGHFPIHPLTLKAKQSFIFRLLTPLGEYQEVWIIKVPVLSWYLIRSHVWNVRLISVFDAHVRTESSWPSDLLYQHSWDQRCQAIVWGAPLLLCCLLSQEVPSGVCLSRRDPAIFGSAQAIHCGNSGGTGIVF